MFLWIFFYIFPFLKLFFLVIIIIILNFFFFSSIDFFFFRFREMLAARLRASRSGMKVCEDEGRHVVDYGLMGAKNGIKMTNTDDIATDDAPERT